MAFNPKIIEGGKGEGGPKGGPARISKNLSLAFAEALEEKGFRVFISENQERADEKAKMREGKLAKWEGDHWRLLDGVEPHDLAPSFEDHAARSGSIVGMATQFSKEADPDKHSQDRAAESVASTARQLLPKVPPSPPFSVVPAKGVWLRPILPNESGVPEEWRGRIRVMAPESSFGVLHRLPVDLGIKEGQEFYEPSPVPAGSKMGKFLASSLPDPGVRQAVQEFLGYTILSHGPNLQVFQIWTGGGGNGKGEMQKLAAALHELVFAYKPNSQSDFSLDGIELATLILTDEWPKRLEGVEELKSIVGDGLLKINRKGRSLYDARVKGKMIVNSNHLPVFPEVNNAIDRRVQVIPWNQKPAEIVDDLAAEILRDEFKIFLDWVLGGLVRLMNRRSTRRPNGFAFETLEISEELKRQSRVESDSVLRFLEESGAFLSAESYAIKGDLYKAYDDWASETGTKSPCGDVEFWKRAARAFPELKSWRQRRGQDRFHVSNLVLPKHAPEEARMRDGEAPEPCPFEAQPVAPGEAEKAACERWIQANPQAEGKGSYCPEWDALLPHAKAILRETVAEGVGREGVAARMAAKIRFLGGNPPRGEEMEAARHRFVEALLD